MNRSIDYLVGRDNTQPTIQRQPPKWVANILPDLEALDQHGREAVRALVRGLKKDDKNES